MNAYRLSEQAEASLAQIVDYVAKDSPANAIKVFDQLHAAMQQLADFPGFGHQRRDLTSKPVLFWSVYCYLIVYRRERPEIEIVDIVHGARDLREYFLGRL